PGPPTPTRPPSAAPGPTRRCPSGCGGDHRPGPPRRTCGHHTRRHGADRARPWGRHHRVHLRRRLAGRTCWDFETGDGRDEAPFALKLDMARQCWDEARHCEISVKLSDWMGTEIGEFSEGT